MEQVERITPGYTKVFGFELVAGDTDCLKRPEGTLIPESMARKLFGEENPIGSSPGPKARLYMGLVLSRHISWEASFAISRKTPG